MIYQMIDKDLIRKFLNGTSTEAEARRVSLFMQQPGAQDLFDEVWEEMEPEMKGSAASPDIQSLQLLRWKKEIRKRISEDGKKAPRTRTHISHFYRYAAACIILIVLGVGGYNIVDALSNGQQSEIALARVSNTYGKNMMIVLPDSSKVWLGAGSTLHYPKEFSGDTRELSLLGEAFFDVTKDPERPFIIQTGEIRTKVLGTSFKIEAFEGGAPNVAVSTGKVRVDREHEGKMQELAVLMPGEQVTWHPKEKQAVKSIVDKNEVLDWKTGKQIFNNVPLQEITTVLERWYDIKINITDRGLKELKIYTSLTNGMAIEKIMDILAATGNFNYTIKGKSIEINKKI